MASSIADTLAPLVHGRERLYFRLMIGVSLLIYAGLVTLVVSAPAATGGILFYAVAIMVAFVLVHGMLVGRLRGNAVRVTPLQFPVLHQMATRHATTLGLATLPDIFVLESGGLMNAFAMRFFGRNFVVVNSDVLAMAEQDGEAAVSFIVAHELAHVQRGHLLRRWLIGPARAVPYLGAAYSRACEYTCDRFGAHCEPEGAIRGLLSLAAGKFLYRRVDMYEFARQTVTDAGFWMRRAELVSSHPHLTRRVAALLAAGVPTPGVKAPPTGTPGVMSPSVGTSGAFRDVVAGR